MGMIGTLISYAVFGLFVGAIARFLIPGRQSMSLLMTILLGITGSLLGGLITWTLHGKADAFEPSGWFMSIVGAIIAVLLYSRVGKRVERIESNSSSLE